MPQMRGKNQVAIGCMMQTLFQKAANGDEYARRGCVACAAVQLVRHAGFCRSRAGLPRPFAFPRRSAPQQDGSAIHGNFFPCRAHPICSPRLRAQEWNAEWLFLNSTSKTIRCPGDCPWKTEAAAMLHLKTIAAHIRGADADVIVLAEVQGCDVGAMLLRELRDPSLRFYLVAGAPLHFSLLCGLSMPRLKCISGTDTSTGQNVALLTRIDPSQPLARSEERVQFPVQGSSCGYQTPQRRKSKSKSKSKLESSGVSKHFTARFSLANPLCNRSSSSCALPALDISLIAAHLVSKPVDPRACAQREAQATGLRCFLNRMHVAP